MASFVYAVLSITNVASVHCAVRPEISPCTCEPTFAYNFVDLSCEKVDSFHKIVDVLSNKFESNVNVNLKISYSQLEDLEMRSFSDMKLNLVKLRMQSNGLRSVPELPFRGLSSVEFLSLADNELEEVPKHMLNHMPTIKTLDMGRCRIRAVLQDDFKGNQMLTNLFLSVNNITRMEKMTFPSSLVVLHLGHNQIEYLNGTLRHLNNLESLFINVNNISNLENELPEPNSLKLILVHNNRLERLPENMRNMDKLETLQIQFNRITSLERVLQNCINLNELHAYNNKIEYLSSDEFQKALKLGEIYLAHNKVKSLNGSLLPLQMLHKANFSFNMIEEFSMYEIKDLMSLKQLDLSNNYISKLSGSQANNIEKNVNLIEFYLDYNQLTTLGGSLMGLSSLRILGLTHNQIERIMPEDFIGLEKLEILELSHNRLLTLKEMQTTVLPSLKILKVDYNNLTVLDKDFHGLPVLCQANLTHNHLTTVSQSLVAKTRCTNHNVPGKLELYLEANPLNCNVLLENFCPILLNPEKHVRLRTPCVDMYENFCKMLVVLPPKSIIPLLSDQLNKKDDEVLPATLPSIPTDLLKDVHLQHNKAENETSIDLFTNSTPILPIARMYTSKNTTASIKLTEDTYIPTNNIESTIEDMISTTSIIPLLNDQLKKKADEVLPPTLTSMPTDILKERYLQHNESENESSINLFTNTTSTLPTTMIYTSTNTIASSKVIEDTHISTSIIESNNEDAISTTSLIPLFSDQLRKKADEVLPPTLSSVPIALLKEGDLQQNEAENESSINLFTNMTPTIPIAMMYASKNTTAPHKSTEDTHIPTIITESTIEDTIKTTSIVPLLSEQLKKNADKILPPLLKTLDPPISKPVPIINTIMLDEQHPANIRPMAFNMVATPSLMPADHLKELHLQHNEAKNESAIALFTNMSKTLPIAHIYTSKNTTVSHKPIEDTHIPTMFTESNNEDTMSTTSILPLLSDQLKMKSDEILPPMLQTLDPPIIKPLPIINTIALIDQYSDDLGSIALNMVATPSSIRADHLKELHLQQNEAKNASAIDLFTNMTATLPIAKMYMNTNTTGSNKRIEATHIPTMITESTNEDTTSTTSAPTSPIFFQNIYSAQLKKNERISIDSWVSSTPKTEYTTMEYIPKFENFTIKRPQPLPKLNENLAETVSLHDTYYSKVLPGFNQAPQSLVILEESQKHP